MSVYEKGISLKLLEITSNQPKKPIDSKLNVHRNNNNNNTNNYQNNIILRRLKVHKCGGQG